MKHSFAALCSDIDGTLLNKDRVLSPRTIKAITSLPDDFQVILASSRMPAAMRHLQADLNILHSPLICYNGAFIQTFNQAGEASTLHSAPIPVDICKAAQRECAGLGLHIGLYRRDDWYVPAQDYWANREENNTQVKPEVADLNQILEWWTSDNEGAHKLMCMGEAEKVERIEQYLRSHFAAELNLYRSKDTYLEVSHRSISKAGALVKVMDYLGGYSLENTIAFGDNYNDMEMLEAVGMGVAVANAKPEVLAMANETTATNKEDGVAIAIEKYLLGD